MPVDILTASGTWDWEGAGSPSEVEVWVIAGGGSGNGNGTGSNVAGGGGGAGGVVHDASYAVSGDVTFTIGAGGDPAVGGVNSAVGQNGADSVWDGILTATGGGGGNGSSTQNGQSGGSGGGGRGGNSGETDTGGTGSQGGNGGTGIGTPTISNRSAGGGGGFGANGGSGSSGNPSGSGGVGIDLSAVVGTGVGDSGWFAGGGGGGKVSGGSPGSGGTGGGGDGTLGGTGQSAMANTGGGGGGGGSTGGGSGGSGVIILRYTVGGDVTGSSAVTEGNDTLAGVGGYTPEAISGSSAVAEGDDTSAASGAVGSSRTGSAAATEGNDTSSAAGTSGGVVGAAGPTRHWFEVWTRPGDPNFGRVIDDPPFARSSIHAGMNILGDGTMDLPNTFDRFDEILYVDRNNPANSVSSLVRCYADSNPLVPAHEWIPSALTPTADKNDPDVNAAGKDINIILTYARTEPYDWDGSDAFGCTACDWIWGGRNLLTDWDFESPIITPTVYELVVTATGGSYTIGASSGTSPTSAITFNAGAATIEAEIESDLSAFPDVLVADASSTNPFRRLIQYVDPPFGPTLVVNTGSLTGGSATLTVTQQGGMKPSGWTPARAVLTGLQPVGFYTTWETSDDQNHTPGGQFSLKIDPGPTGATSNRNGGAQQVVSVTPGQTYQASVWIYPTSATDRFRLNISTIGEEIVATSGGNGQTLTANTWSQISVPDVVIPDGVTQVVFRVQNTSPFPANPSTFYVDDAEFNEGLNAATPGEVIRLLYESYVDPALQGTIYWDDGSGTDTPYLTLDFSDTLDSAGAPWDETDVELRVYQRMNLFQVLSQLAGSYGVEFRVVPDDVELGTWKLTMFNEEGMGTDYTAAATPAVLGGSDDTRRQLRRFLPVSDHVVEGENRFTGRARNTGFVSALGKIGGERIDRTVPGTEAAALAAATEDSDDALLTGQSWDYEFTDPLLAPLTHYNLGDTLTVHDPPEADGPGRVWDVTGVFSPERERWEVEFLVEEEA